MVCESIFKEPLVQYFHFQVFYFWFSEKKNIFNKSILPPNIDFLKNFYFIRKDPKMWNITIRIHLCETNDNYLKCNYISVGWGFHVSKRLLKSG